MRAENLEVCVSWENGQWVIREVGFPNSAGIKVDALVMQARERGSGFVRGRIISVHGLDQSIASQLGAHQLRMIGVGAQINHTLGKERHTHLGVDGKITGGHM